MPTLTLDRLIALLRQYAARTEHSVDLLLIGGLAMLAYGHASRATIDVDGELRVCLAGRWWRCRPAIVTAQRP